MKPRLTIRQRLVRSLSKRIKVVRVYYPVTEQCGIRMGGYHRWECHMDGIIETSGKRQWARDSRLVLIQDRATTLLSDMRALQCQGFKVTFP